MRTPSRVLCAVSRTLLCPALLCVSAFASQAFGTESPISVLSKAPLSLPRLATGAAQLGHKPVRSEAFEVLSFVPGQRAKSKSRSGAAYLEIEPDSEWHQKLRIQRAGANYVTFSLNGSTGSVVDIAGASITIEQSQQDAGYAAIRANGADEKINHEVQLMLFGGARMATLDIVTVKIDRQARTWTMWFRDVLVAEDLPLSDQAGDGGQIRIVAGKGGAWLCGLVCSDENPLFEDANDNAVPDEFEHTILDTLLSKNASKQSKATLRLAWQEERQSRPPSVFVLTTPLPDSFPEACSPEGETVHGMTSGFKFGTPRKN